MEARLWVVVNPGGEKLPWTARVVRKTSINLARGQFEKSWERLRRKGYRCVRVHLEEGWGDEGKS